MNFPTNVSPYGVVLGLFNADGVVDIAAASQGGSVSIFPGTGGGNFGAPTTVTTSLGSSGLVAVDFDEDGNLDLATANQFSASASVLFGDGAGNVASIVTLSVPAASAPDWITSGDFNNDVNADIAVGTLTGSVFVFLGNGAGGFGASMMFSGGPSVSHLLAGDFNNDSDLDIVTSGYFSANTATVILGNGDGTFGPPAAFATGNVPTQVVSGLFNADTNLDVAVANYESDTVSILLGTGAGSFSAAMNFATGAGPVCVQTADANADGILDLVTGDYDTTTVSVLLGAGDGTFGTPASFSCEGGAASLALGDVNADGRVDIVTANYGSDSISVLLNTCVPPCEITCPANVTVSNDVNLCGAVVNYPAPTSTGNCGTIECIPPSGSLFPAGTTTVTCRETGSTSGRGGTACSFTITVNAVVAFGACAVDDATGDSWSIVTDPANPNHRFWQYRVAATGEIFCGFAENLAIRPGRTLTAADTIDPRFSMNANLNYGSNSGTVQVSDRQSGRQFRIRDRSLANSACL